MQSWFARKITLPYSSTCTIGGGGVALCLCKTPKIKRVKDRSHIAISKNVGCVTHGWDGGCYAIY